MVKIIWSEQSLEDLKNIYDYIAADSKHYARSFTERIVEFIEHLASFPKLGRRVPESDDENIREIIFKNYRIIYQINKGYLELITVIHGSRILKL